MLKKIISHISQKKATKENKNFFDLSLAEQKKLIRKAAELSGQDQQDLLKKYEQKFGKLKTHS